MSKSFIEILMHTWIELINCLNLIKLMQKNECMGYDFLFSQVKYQMQEYLDLVWFKIMQKKRRQLFKKKCLTTLLPFQRNMWNESDSDRIYKSMHHA